MVDKWRKVFQSGKVVIGALHLPPLPGAPLYKGKLLREIATYVVKEAKKLEEGGVNALIIENYGDKPYRKRVGPETVASMTTVALKVSESVNIPIGINVLRNDVLAALSIAKAVNAKFVRSNVQSGVYVTDQGLIEGEAFETQRFKKLIFADNVLVLADVFSKHASPLSSRSIEDEAHDLFFRGLVDAIIVTGPRTGLPPSLDDVKKVKETIQNGKVLVGSGLNLYNAEKLLKECDGAIVGTYFKENGVINIKKVEKLVETVRKLR